MKCTFKGPHLFDTADRYRDYQCQQEGEFDSLCIFHVEKTRPAGPTQTQLTKWGELNQRCDKEFLQLVEKQLNDPDVAECDFRGFHLPTLALPKMVSKPMNLHDAQIDFVMLDGVEFLGRVDFGDCKLREIADFSNCIFRETVDCYNTEFMQSALFAETKFMSEAKFWGTKFKAVWFNYSEFATVNFFMAEIDGKAVFDHATFSNLAMFTHSKFNGDATFLKAVYDSASSFSSSIFSALADFEDTEFGAMSNFHKATFLGRVRFRNSIFKNVSFAALDLGKDSDVVFETLSLAKASFLDTNLQEIRFRDVRWHRLVGSAFLGRRRASLWDEFSPSGEKQREFERIAENYRQLVLAYERKRDFEIAEDFHIGEMEMRRKKMAADIKDPRVRKIREWINSYSLYRRLSNYGTSYVQALLVLVLFLCVFSIAFLYSGFRTTENPQRIIEYNVLADSSHHHVSTREWAGDYLSAMSLCASIATFQRERFYEPVPGISRFWLFASAVGLTGQVAMILLALRRRFRR
ncbi:MAG: hypothetical protein QOH41_1448 [Blastocatellia bacterium]|jgi:uncharacterized protein YjbI with pentapeptide repeats|nr:hypothetical protein [Blastocatellia bacterium]